MKISQHADKTEKLFGIRAEDIHKWIDGFFDLQSFDEFIASGTTDGYDPYSHRKFRHCKETLADAIAEFEGKYTHEQIKSVFECHLQDDYNGYLPCREDFKNGTFTERYHEAEEQLENERILSEHELSEYFKGKYYAGKKQQAQSYWLSGFHLKIALPILLSTALFIIAIFVIVIPLSRQNLMESRKVMLKEMVNTAQSLIMHQIARAQAGEISEQQAREIAAADIKALHYGTAGKDYFWITDTHPRMIMHPYLPELNGHDLTDYVDSKDKSRKKLFVEFVKLTQNNQGEGYMEYLWQWQDNPDLHVPKLSFVRLIPQWGWIIGTGMYIHDVEQQISAMTINLMWTFLVISVFLFVVVLYTISQSRRIENERLQAQTGLIEAKERYRALVEASSEGYILMLEGKNIFSNLALQRMLGYSEKELACDDIWQKLLPENKVNLAAVEHLAELNDGRRSSSEFEARLQSKSGLLIDVIIKAARIFLSEKDGHVLTIRRITAENLASQISGFDIISNYDQLPAGIIEAIESAQSQGHIIHSVSQVPAMVRSMTVNGVKSPAIRQAICRIFDAVMVKFIILALQEMQTQDVDFAFVTLGSNARQEMTMFSDQDNAIIFDNVDSRNLEQVRGIFLRLADKVCTMLDKAGYPYCPGGIMAINPHWCLTLDEWKARFTSETIMNFEKSTLEINTIFDIRCIYGSQSLTDAAQAHMMAVIDDNPEFFIYLTRNALNYDLPLSLLGQLRTETIDGEESLNIKDPIVAIVNIARVYALKNRIKTPGTISRLSALLELGQMSQEQYDETVQVFNHLWYLRFYNQIICHSNLRRVNDELIISNLSEAQQENLKESLTRISLLQTRLSYDILGMAN